MVCWIKRLKKLGIDIPQGIDVEKELMKELDVTNHVELEKMLMFIHNETLESIMEKIIKRKKTIIRENEPVADIYR